MSVTSGRNRSSAADEMRGSGHGNHLISGGIGKIGYDVSIVD
jgi:hypothetical protein